MNSNSNPKGAVAQPAGFERESTLIRRELPPLASRGLALVLIALFVAAVLAAVYVRFPETVHATFVLVPERGANPITSPRRGTVASVHIEDAQEVKAGDVLYVIRADELRQLATEKAALEKESASTTQRMRELENENKARAALDKGMAADVEAKIKRLMDDQHEAELRDAALEQRYKVSMSNAEQRIKSAEREVEMEHKRLELVKGLKERAESSFRSNILTEFELIRQQYTYQLADVELLQCERRNTEAQAALSELEVGRGVELREQSKEHLKLSGELAEARASVARMAIESEAREILAQDRTRQMQGTLAKVEIQLESMARELKGAEDGLLKVLAPYSGTVTRLGAQRVGEVIERGTVLCELAAGGEKLVAELTIPEKDAGVVAKGQKIKMLFSAYPYTRFGTRKGTLSWLSPTAGAKGSFRALAQLDETGVMLHGRERSFMAGMGGEARVLAGERTLIEFVLEPLNQLKENVGKD